MLAKPESVTQLLHKGMPIEPDGVLQQTDVTSMLILDITPQDLQSLKPHFTPQALKDILITGMGHCLYSFLLIEVLTSIM